jgi:diaminobutyrate-2-oxoglutarate transaminase
MKTNSPPNEFPWASGARSYSRRIPAMFVSASGARLFDAQGRSYLDFLTGAGASVLGHGHPCIVDTIREYDRGFISHLDLHTSLEDEFVRNLLEILPFSSSDETKVHFCGPTGSDAVEAALKLSRIATGRSSVWAFMGSYHGMTQGALSVTSNKQLRRVGLHSAHDVVFFPFPSPSALGEGFASEESAAGLTTLLMEMAINDDHSGIEKPAAILIEPVQGEGGIHVASTSFMRFLRSFCDANDIVLVCDEIQSGFGRTGEWFACEHAGIEPDILCVSKGLGGGLPLALIAYKAAFDKWPSASHIGTFRGPSLSIAVANAIINFARDNLILKNVNSAGRHLLAALAGLKREFPIIRDIRGLGLFLGVEFNPSIRDFPQRMGSSLIENGVIAEVAGRGDTTLKLLPPLNIDRDTLDLFLQKFRKTLKELDNSGRWRRPAWQVMVGRNLL